MTRYRTIVADPPWHYDRTAPPKKSRGRNAQHVTAKRTITLPYPTLSVDAIAAIPVSDLAEPDAHLYLWTTQRYLRDSYSVLDAWGFSSACVLVWCKEPSGWHIGGSYASSVEFLHFAKRGSLPAIGRVDRQWFPIPRTKGPGVGYGQQRQSEHSRKPEAFLDRIEQVSPGPYLEMFARRQRLGWDTWGNEALPHVEMPA